MQLKLIRLTLADREAFFDMMDEWTADLRENNGNHSPWAIFRNDYHDLEHYIAHLDVPEGTEGLVPDTTLFCVDTERNRFVGAVNIRHRLNEGLLRFGGHIGDGIRPSERGKGCGTAMVALALEECRRLGIRRVLMCCDRDNAASAKTIIRNGGVLENEISEDGGIVQRYWIDLTEQA